MILKLAAHFVTCECLIYFLENKFGLTGAKFWVLYIILAAVIWIINAWDSHK